MRKGVFIYSNFDFSVKNAGVTRMLYYALALANKNTAVYLVSCSATSIEKNSFKEFYPNVFILENNTLTQSFSGTFIFIKNLFKFSQEVVVDRVFIFYPSPLVYLEIISLFYLKFIKKCRVYYELNEVRKYSSAFHKKARIKTPKYAIKKIVFKAVFSNLESCLRFYSGLICISTPIVNYSKKFNSSVIRIPILTNPELKKEFSNSIYCCKDSFNIGFSGKVHPDKENLLNFFKVLGALKKNHYRFTFNLCGPFEKRHKNFLLEQVANDLDIKDNIKYFGNLNAKELSTFLNQQQVLIIPRGYTLQNHYGFSTKLSDYLNHRKPILVTDVSDNKLFIEDGKNGFIVPPDDNKEMYNKLAYIVDNYSKVVNNIQEHAMETSYKSFYYKNFTNELSEFLFKD
jgi:glycosyltransferase involved in cell wall biosynthesis